MTVSSVLPSGSRDVAQQSELEGTIREYLEKRSVQALVRLVTAPDPFAGGQKLVETYGLGPLVPNTVLLGDSEQASHRDRYCQMISQIHQAKRSIVVLRENHELGFGKRRRIDVWWGGLQANGGLMLLLAYLLRSDIDWNKAEIYLKLVVPDETAAQAARVNLESLIQRLRIKAISQVLVAQGRPFPQILHETSENADIIFLGMRTPGDGDDFTQYYENLQTLAAGLPTTIFVLAAPGFAFEEVLTDS